MTELGVYILGAVALILLFAFGWRHDDTTVMLLTVLAAGSSYVSQIASHATGAATDLGNMTLASWASVSALVAWLLALLLWVLAVAVAFP